MITSRERFLAAMDYRPLDRVPNHELGVWGQTIERWNAEGASQFALKWDWFVKEDFFDLDYREFISVDWGMMPSFDAKVIERTDRYEVIQHGNGIVTKALIDGMKLGTRASMDQYLRFPVENIADFRNLVKRYDAHAPKRLPPDWREKLNGWRNRDHVLVMGRNCSCGGFYWRAREWMGTENLSLAWYDQPALMHEMMEFYADFTMETCRPILDETDVEYFNLNEDLAMKNGPLLGPSTFKEFIYPHLKRMVEFFKSRGTRYFCLDSDGNPEPLIPLMMDAGVDCLWPLERASDVNPIAIRKKFGKTLRLWGGVDKRELAKGPDAIDRHLRELAPLVEDGGFIPAIDHTVPPDVSWDNFCHYMKRKRALLEGRLRTGL